MMAEPQPSGYARAAGMPGPRPEPSPERRPERSAAAQAQPRLVINGRFLTQRLSGVQRFASEIVREIDTLLAEDASAYRGKVELHLPLNCGVVPAFRAIDVKRSGRLNGHAWEQFDLVRAARGARLLSLGNTGPLLHPRQLVVIHDAAVLAYPANFTFAFRGWYQILYNVFARCANVATVSEFSAAELSRYLPLKREAIRVVPNGGNHLAALTADDSVLSTNGLTSNGYVLAIASQSKTKNTAIIGAALALLPEPRPTVVLVGARNARIFQTVVSEGADAAVELGGLSDGQLKALYENAMCFVFPSFYEGFGLPPVEAMSCRCPVIASDIGALREVCGAGAIFFDPHNAADLASKIAGIATGGRDSLAPLLKAGAERAGTFVWRKSADLLLRHVSEV
jgi:glycosyltransferase involved in cell wall biosynthesis